MKSFLLFSVIFIVFISNSNKLLAQADDYIYHKAFIEDDSLKYHTVEFKKSGIYVDGKQAVNLKVQTAVVIADFVEMGDRYFVTVTAVTNGTCGYNGFVIISITEKMDVKISSEFGKNKCVGESPDIAISWNKKYQRIISIAGSYKYNISTQKWSFIKSKVVKK